MGTTFASILELLSLMLLMFLMICVLMIISNYRPEHEKQAANKLHAELLRREERGYKVWSWMGTITFVLFLGTLAYWLSL